MNSRRVMSQTPLLSVRLMVYNNEPFIREALDGILMQQVDFPYEIVIGDDFSTDGTADILHEYAAKHPDIIHLLDRPKGGPYQLDRQRFGRIHNFVDIVNHCRGKYIAILDGDDYWTDPEKLQLQVDFLEANPDFSITFHQAKELDENGSEKLTNEDQPEVTEGNYLLKTGWHMRSASIVFRKDQLPPWPSWIYTIESMDYNLQCMLTRDGQKIKYFARPMCVYRLHSNTVSSKINKDIIVIMKRNLSLLHCIRSFQHREDFLETIDNRVRHIRTQLLYHLRAKTRKSLADWARIIELAARLGKFKPSNIKKAIANRI